MNVIFGILKIPKYHHRSPLHLTGRFYYVLFCHGCYSTARLFFYFYMKSSCYSQACIIHAMALYSGKKSIIHVLIKQAPHVLFSFYPPIKQIITQLDRAYVTWHIKNTFFVTMIIKILVATNFKTHFMSDNRIGNKISPTIKRLFLSYVMTLFLEKRCK